jgi:hypothetical protein
MRCGLGWFLTKTRQTGPCTGQQSIAKKKKRQHVIGPVNSLSKPAAASPGDRFRAPEPSSLYIDTRLDTQKHMYPYEYKTSAFL